MPKSAKKRTGEIKYVGVNNKPVIASATDSKGKRINSKNAGIKTRITVGDSAIKESRDRIKSGNGIGGLVVGSSKADTMSSGPFKKPRDADKKKYEKDLKAVKKKIAPKKAVASKGQMGRNKKKVSK